MKIEERYDFFRFLFYRLCAFDCMQVVTPLGSSSNHLGMDYEKGACWDLRPILVKLIEKICFSTFLFLFAMVRRYLVACFLVSPCRYQ